MESMTEIEIDLFEEYNIEKAVDNLIFNIIYSMKKKNKDFFIVPVARRGIRVLELSKKYSKDLFAKKVVFYDSIDFHIKDENLKNKNIILFDEGLNTGKTLHARKRELVKKLGLDEDEIFTAALLVNLDAMYPPNFKGILLDSDSYDYMSQKLNYEILSTGKPLDVDHLIYEVFIAKELIPDFIHVLQKEFYAKELRHSGSYDDVRMFTIDLKISSDVFSFYIPEIKNLPKIFDNGPQKIRIFIKAGSIHIVPIVYPAMEIKDDILQLKNNCPIQSILGDACLCKIMSDNLSKVMSDDTELNVLLQSTICYNCIVNALTTSLLSEFLIKLKKHISFHPGSLDDKSIQVISHDESRDLIKKLNDKIIDSWRKNNIISINGTRAKKSYFRDIEVKKVKDLTMGYKYKLLPEVIIAIAVKKNKKINENLIYGKNYNKTVNPPPYGISYDQIYEATEELDPSEFSEGMDIACDVGYLKPIMPFQGIKISCDDKDYEGIIRLYTTTSEDLDHDIECFLRLLTPQGGDESASH